MNDKELAEAFLEFRNKIKWLEAENLALRERVIVAEQHESIAWQAGWDNCFRLRRDPDKRFTYAEWKRSQDILDYSSMKEMEGK